MTTPAIHPDSSIYIFACVEISRSLTSQFFLYMLNNREINAVMEHEFGGEKRASAKLSMPCNCMPGKSIELPMTDLITNAKLTDSTYNIAFLRRSMASAIVSVHDEIKRRKLDDKEEEMEFLRHIRNACSHGNRFTFRDGEPRRLAKLKNLEITRSLEGMSPLLFDFITLGTQ
jgi:hypothetical protein